MEEVIKELQLIKSAFISLGIHRGRLSRAQVRGISFDYKTTLSSVSYSFTLISFSPQIILLKKHGDFMLTFVLIE